MVSQNMFDGERPTHQLAKRAKPATVEVVQVGNCSNVSQHPTILAASTRKISVKFKGSDSLAPLKINTYNTVRSKNTIPSTRQQRWRCYRDHF